MLRKGSKHILVYYLALLRIFYFPLASLKADANKIKMTHCYFHTLRHFMPFEHLFVPGLPNTRRAVQIIHIPQMIKCFFFFASVKYTPLIKNTSWVGFQFSFLIYYLTNCPHQ